MMKVKNNKQIVAKRPFLSTRFIPLAVVLLLGTLLSLLLPDFFRQVILFPIISRLQVVFYGLYRIYHGIPQNVLWGGFVFMTLWVMLRGLRPPDSPRDEPFTEKTETSRLNHLIKLATDAHSGQHGRWELAREIERIAVKLMQNDAGETAVSLRERIHRGDLTAPPEIISLLELCASLPSYRSFTEARSTAAKNQIPQLAAIDLDATVAALTHWRELKQEQL
ncbi:MAG: hypothetical protein GY805_21465 [Chloroflexi bacterium]|nr:hypothetical protein [Chloroflexota bacterium]